jgi:large subunit ribosomal protein L11
VAKQITKKIKLQIPAGRATPAPPVGTVLGPAGINLQEFCTRYNDATKDKVGDILPVEISIYDDRSFDFVIKTPPAAFLLLKYAKLKSGSAKGANQVVATLKEKDIKEIAEIKMADLNAYDLEAAMRIIEGTARNMGIAVEGVNDAELAEQGKEALEEERELARREAELAALEAEAHQVRQAVEEETEEKEEEETKEEQE